jgi:histidinol-phosphatase (PHP family)
MSFMSPLTDAHVHPDFSIDSMGSIEEYCNRAIELELVEIIFTTHVNTNPNFPDRSRMLVDGECVPTTVDSIRRYADAVWSAREQYYELGLMVKCGVEVDFFPEISDEILRALEDRLIEYRLVGVHRIGDLAIARKDEASKLYEKYSVPELLEKYYSLVKQASTYRLFDSVAHLDYYRRYAPEDKLDEVMRIDFNFIDDTLESLVENEISIEVNTSALRHGHKEYYPGMALLNKVRKAGVLIRYLGSDAHSPEHLAHDFDNGELIVYETNVHDIDEG